MNYQQENVMQRSVSRHKQDKKKHDKNNYTNPIPLQKKAFSAVSFPLRGEDVIQRKVVDHENKRLLVEDNSAEGKDNVIAEVDKDRSLYIHFLKPQYIKSRDVMNLAQKNNGRIESNDFLALFADKQKEVIKNEKLKIDKYQHWTSHTKNYEEILGFMVEVMRIGNDALLKREDLYIYLVNNYNLLFKYCGSDCLDAMIILLKETNDAELQNICREEGQRRINEMNMEYQFCTMEANRKGKKQGAEFVGKDKRSHGLLGNDCGEFAKNTASVGLGELGEYQSVKGYAYHKWLNLTSIHDKLEDGVATAETCAGQGGLFRTVFGIRPTKNKEDIEKDKNSITRMSQSFHTNPKILNHRDKIIVDIFMLEDLMAGKEDINKAVWNKLLNSVAAYGNDKAIQEDAIKKNARELAKRAVNFLSEYRERFYT